MKEDRRRHLSMLRSYTGADLLTIGNAACGAMTVFLCLDYLATDDRRFLWIAFALLACERGRSGGVTGRDVA